MFYICCDSSCFIVCLGDIVFHHVELINSCPAELLHLYFLSFEAGIMLTQFPASNEEEYYYLWKIDMSKIKLLDQQSVY